MKIRILGSGTSTGVPEIGCTCAVCTSKDPRDCRLRTSALVYTDDATILLDCGPDFREQMLRVPFGKIDAVLISHEHYDHVGGLDDLRPFCRFGEVPIYAETYTAERLRSRMPYCFVEHSYPGVPNIPLREIEPNRPFLVNHTDITDMLTMPDESFEQLQGIEVLVMNALRIAPHNTHQSLSEALEAVKRIGAKETWLIHMSHHIGLQADVEKQLPPHVHFAFDGLELEC